MRGARGWSLIELVLVITIVGMLAVFIGPLLMRAITAYDVAEGTLATYAKMRYAMERIAREVREVRRSPADSTAFDISAMTASSFSFVKLDGTQVSLGSGAGNVTLAYGGVASGTLTDQVGAFTIAYYRHDGTTAAANATEVEVVEIALTLTDGPNSYPSRLRLGLRTPQ